MKFFYKIITILFITIGIIHIAVTPIIFNEFSPASMWFVSGGLAVILLSFVNIAIIRTSGKDRIIKYLGILANLITTVFAIVYIISFDREPQNFIILFLLICLSGLSIKFNESSSETRKTA